MTPPWPALVLTAGLGTRLRPLTYVRAKPAVPVAGETLVRRIIRWLHAHGVRNVVLNLHYRPETIAAVVGDGGDLRVRVRYSWENPVLGSAGGPARALPLLDADRFFLINGDTLSDVDLGALARQHAGSGARVTMALTPNPDPGRYGGVGVDQAGRVTGFTRPDPRSPSHHFIGIQAVEASVFAALDPTRPAQTVTGVYPALIAAEPDSVRAFVCGAAFHDIGTPADYLATSLTFARAEGHETLPVGRRTSIDSSAHIERTALWDDVVVEAGSQLVECVVADGVRVPAGCRFERRAIIPATGRTPAAGETILGNLLIAPLDGIRREG